MEFEHAFQQSGFFEALQVMIVGSLLAPGVMGRGDLYRTFVGSLAANVISFGPLGLLVYVLYKVSHLC